MQQFVVKKKLQAAVIVTAVGSLDSATIRMAGATPEKSRIKLLREKLEVVSLVGTIAQDMCHVHIAVATKTGKVIGGHLKGEALVDTTMEIILGEVDDVRFARKMDAITGFDELHVIKK